MKKQYASLQERQNPVWTEDLLLHLKKYGWKEYGYECCNEYYNTEKDFLSCLEKQTRKLEMGLPQQFHTNGRYFDINYLGSTAGFVLLVPTYDPIYGEVLELEVGVFDRYSKNKIASNALDIIIEQYSNNRLDAIIRSNNSNKDRIEGLLKQKGFQLDNEDDTLWFYHS